MTLVGTTCTEPLKRWVFRRLPNSWQGRCRRAWLFVPDTSSSDRKSSVDVSAMGCVSARRHLRSATRRFWWFRDAGSAHSVHGPSLWPARRFGTHYRTAWEIRILAGTTSDVCWRRIYLHCTEAFSALVMFQDDTLYKLSYLLLTYFTYLLGRRQSITVYLLPLPFGPSA